MGVGNKNAALALEQAIAVIPVEKDAFDGPAPIEILARVAAHMGTRPRNCRVTENTPGTVRGSAGRRAVPLPPVYVAGFPAPPFRGCIGLRATVADFQLDTYFGYADNFDGYPPE